MKTSAVPALTRGLDILEMLSDSDQGLGFNEIGESLELPTTTLARLLKLLVERGYAEKDGTTGRYRAGPRMLLLGHRTPIIDRIRRACRGTLRAAADAARNSALLIHWNGHHMQCLAKETHEESLSLQAVGTIMDDLTGRAWGWIFLDSMDPDAQKKHIADKKATKGVIAEIKAATAKYHANHFTYEDKPTIRRMAAPVFDDSNRIVGALGLGGNSLTIREDRIDALGKILIKHAAEISTKIGWPGA